MIHQNDLTRLSAALCAGALLLSHTSCDNDNKIINEEYEIISPAAPVEKPVIEEVTFPAAILGNFGATEAILKNSFTNIVDPQAAKILLVTNDAIEEYEDILSQAYNNGGLIVIFNPNGSVVADWSDRNGIFYAGPDKDEKCAIYGFNNVGTYYSLQDTPDIDDEDVPLFHFCNWINNVAGNRFKGTDLRTKDIKRRFAPQSVTHTFKLSLNEQQLIDGHWATEDQLSVSTTANVTYNIYPLHVFDGNAKGDYYAVEAELLLHNAPMDNGKWVRHRGDEMTQICGFYLSHCDLSANLLRKSNGSFIDSDSFAFAQGTRPHPTSSSDASDYNYGFEWNLDATVSGGIPDSKDNHKLTSFNNWTWNNSSPATLPGIEIVNNDNPSKVAYSLLVKNLPDASDNLEITPIPDLATGDLSFKYSWIWHVADVTEDNNECFYMQVGLDAFYQAYQWITAGGKMSTGEFENNGADNKTIFKFPLTPPNRIPTCSTIIRNTADGSYYVSDIKLWRNKQIEGEPDIIVPQTISTPTATGGSGVSATMLMLPAGEYMVEAIRYSIENDEHINEQTIVTAQPIALTMAGNVTIDFASDNFIVK